MRNKKRATGVFLIVVSMIFTILIIGTGLWYASRTKGATHTQGSAVHGASGQGKQWNTVMRAADSEMNSVLRDKQIHSYLYTVTAEELKAVTAEFDTAMDWVDLENRFVILDKVEDCDIVLYGLSGFDGMVLRDGEHVYPLEVPWASPRITVPQVFTADYDDDGTQEYAVTTVVFTGTGIHIGQLYIVEPSAALGEIAYYGDMELEQALNERITAEWDEEWNMLEVAVDGEYRTTIGLKRVEELYEASYSGLFWGDHMIFTERIGQLWLCAETGVLLEGMVMPAGGYWFRVTAPVRYDASGAFSLGDIHLEVEADEELHDAEDTVQPKEREVNVLLADVTHDGIEEWIVTSVEYMEEQEDMDVKALSDSYVLGHVRVYEGNTVQNGYEQGYCIWEREFAVSRPGNVQISVVERENLLYLLTSYLGFQQGSLSYSYDVFSLDADGRVFMEDAQQLNYDVGMDEEMNLENDTVLQELIGIFRGHIAGWLGNAVLIVATDVNTPEGTFISEGGTLLAPDCYYDVILGTE